MKLSFNESSGTPTFTIEHHGEILEWDAKEYNTQIKGTVLEDINGYWENLPKNRVNAIWDIYKKIHTALNEIFDFNQLHGKLVGLVKDLYEQHPMEEIEYWVNVKLNTSIPPGIKSEYSNEDSRFVERTYLASDYRGLMSLAVALRPMLPVWSDYLRKIKSQINTRDKEYIAMRLLTRSNLVVSEPLQRFRRYVEASITTESSTIASIIGALGTEETPDWLMSIGVVKSLAVGEIGVSVDGSTLISNVYNKMITNTINVIDRKFGGRVRDKLPRDNFDEDKASIIENYKMKQLISDGDVVAVDVYVENAVKMSEQLDPLVPAELVSESLLNFFRFEDFDIQQHHITITQWVLSSVTPVRGIPALSYHSLLSAMGVAQAHLIHRGHVEQALMLGAQPVVREDGNLLAGGEERPRLQKETTERLLALYPHYQRPFGSKAGTARQQNPAIKAIDLLVAELIRFQWQTHPTETLKVLIKDQQMMMDRYGILTVSARVRDQLAELIIDNNARRKEYVSRQKNHH